MGLVKIGEENTPATIEDFIIKGYLEDVLVPEHEAGVSLLVTTPQVLKLFGGKEEFAKIAFLPIKDWEQPELAEVGYSKFKVEKIDPTRLGIDIFGRRIVGQRVPSIDSGKYTDYVIVFWGEQQPIEQYFTQ